MTDTSSALQLSPRVELELESTPTFEAVEMLGLAALESSKLATAGYKKMLGFLLELGDGRDRREPWATRDRDTRPVPRLRLAMEGCFGVYADVHWFNVNKLVNASRMPLLGLFPRFAFGLGRVRVDDLASVVEALLSEAPDGALLRLLQARSGRVPGLGVESFSRLAYAHRRDLYFTLPRPWSERSGARRYIGSDLRRYTELCRNLRTVCDELDIPAETRGSVLDHLLSRPTPPAPLVEALHDAIGPTLARSATLDVRDGYEGDDDLAALPTDFAAETIRARRGRRALRIRLLRDFGPRCALTGTCVPDLLEVAYILPYPTVDTDAPETAILLRSDLHTLWDLNRIGIEPATRRVYLAKTLEGTTYEQLAGRTLATRLDGSAVSRRVLKERWRLFLGANPTAQPEQKASRPKREDGTDRNGIDRDPNAKSAPAHRREETTRAEPAHAS
jgi:hypothetical protein